MTTKGILGVALGALAYFVWGFVFWGLLPTASMIFRGFEDESAVAEAIREQSPEAGAYLVPDAGLMGSDAPEYGRRHERGPVAMVFVHPRGLPVMPASMMGAGFVSMLVAVLLMALLVRMAAPALDSPARVIGFVVLAGLVSVVLIDLGNPIWWRHPFRFYVANALYHTVGWLLVGSILAYLRPAPARKEA